MDAVKDKWLVVVNVFAASKKAGSVWKKAAVMLEQAGVPYKAMFTGGEDNAIEISRKASAAGYRRFVAVGGDGTVHDVLNGGATVAFYNITFQIHDHNILGLNDVVIHGRGAHCIKTQLSVKNTDVAGCSACQIGLNHLDTVLAHELTLFL